ncbi:hypothetical protein NEPAR04_1151 [Nematocida parisii]|nr:hypothetical protein NEPAR08_1075 [Nematocida parisii]KAI5128393.1 hypothetical protein NEPAR03_1302 [Nematocida parisii]KAI5141679.1 hypothetical protein NEPAR04_1151 [Nematocida parisii]
MDNNRLPQEALERVTQRTDELMERYNKYVDSLKDSYHTAEKERKEFLSSGIEFTKLIENKETEKRTLEVHESYKKLLDDRTALSKAFLAEINSVLSLVDQELLLLESPYEPKFGIQTQNPRIFKTNKNNPKRIKSGDDKEAFPSDGKYCICNGPAYGDMIACDAFHMEIPWFHMECMGLFSAPRGNWLCPKCQPPE